MYACMYVCMCLYVFTQSHRLLDPCTAPPVNIHLAPIGQEAVQNDTLVFNEALGPCTLAICVCFRASHVACAALKNKILSVSALQLKPEVRSCRLGSHNS